MTTRVQDGAAVIAQSLSLESSLERLANDHMALVLAFRRHRQAQGAGLSRATVHVTWHELRNLIAKGEALEQRLARFTRELAKDPSR